MDVIPSNGVEMTVGNRIFYVSRAGIYANGILISGPLDPDRWASANMPQEEFDKCARQIIVRCIEWGL